MQASSRPGAAQFVQVATVSPHSHLTSTKMTQTRMPSLLTRIITCLVVAALTLAGASLGAIVAFGIARRLGRDAVRGSRLTAVAWIARPRSQHQLMALVFLSRLVPFISFDAVSYAAGLSALAAWRFALATLAGIVPMSYLLAAAGAGLVQAPRAQAPLVAVLIALTAVPFLVMVAIRRRRRES